MDIGLLVLHVAVGLAFAAHGAQKLFGLFGGHGIDGTAGFFEQIGLRPGRLHAWASGIAEFGGGILIALGLFVPFAAAALIAVMVAAVLTVHLPNGFFNSDNGYEYNLELVAVAFALAAIGAGDLSLDAAFGLDLAGTAWALGALGAGVLGGGAAVLTGRLAADRRGSGEPLPTS
jgi:putative oxidoreductase